MSEKGPELVDSQRVRILSEPPVGGSIIDNTEFLTAKQTPSSLLSSNFFPFQKNECVSVKDPLSASLVSCRAAMSMSSR